MSAAVTSSKPRSSKRRSAVYMSVRRVSAFFFSRRPVIGGSLAHLTACVICQSMSNYATLRPALSERLPIVTYTNLFWPVAATVWMSPQTERITGYAVADWVGNPGFFESVIHPADRKAVLDEAYASRRKKRAFSADYRILRPDGRVMWIHDESVPIDDAHGRHE